MIQFSVTMFKIKQYSMIRLLNYSVIRLFCYSIILLFSYSCASIPKGEQEHFYMPVSIEEFAAKPFGFDLTLQNFEENYKNVLKRQRYFITLANGNVDTMYNFYKGRKTGIFFHKYGQHDGRLVGGKIRKSQVELNNGIRTGMSRKEFFEKFTDLYYDESDALVIESRATRCTFTFVFSRNKLKEIRILLKRPES